METYRLKSKLVENDKEFVIQTFNDPNLGSILSTIYVNGQVADKVASPHPLEINPEEVLSLVKLTHQEQKKEIETLLDAYHKVLASGDAEMMFHLGTAFFYKRLYPEAQELFQAVVTMDPEHHQSYNYLGLVFLALGNIPKAIENCRTAVEKRPGYADYRNNLGEAYLADNSPAHAVRELEEATRINLYYADAYFNLGLAFLMQLRDSRQDRHREVLPAKASDCFTKASLIYPDYESSLFEQGMRALQSSDFQEALSVFFKVRELKKEKHRREFATFYMKFVMYPDWVSEEIIADRIRFLQAEIEKNPTYLDLHTELAQCYLEQAKFAWQKGIKQYKKTLEINPALSKSQHAVEVIEKEYENICAVLKKVEKN